MQIEIISQAVDSNSGIADSVVQQHLNECGFRCFFCIDKDVCYETSSRGAFARAQCLYLKQFENALRKQY